MIKKIRRTLKGINYKTIINEHVPLIFIDKCPFDHMSNRNTISNDEYEQKVPTESYRFKIVKTAFVNLMN